MSLAGKIAIVTGASRGIGRGIALQLGEAGATVYVTGRPPKLSLQTEHDELPTLQSTAEEITSRGGKGIAVYIDHSNSSEIEKLFKLVEQENDGTIDILVNNAYSAVNALCETSGKTFWETEPELWDEVNNVGLRNHYFCCVYGARLMVPRKCGLIVNISSAGGLRYIFNVAYGVGKCAMDRMAADMAVELKKHNVAIVSLWPGAVRTELITKFLNSDKTEGHFAEQMKMMKKHFDEGETPEFVGKAIVTLAEDPKIMSKSGRTLVAADLGIDYRFKDIDGRQPASLRSVKSLLAFSGCESIASYFPGWIRVPGWLLTALTSRL